MRCGETDQRVPVEHHILPRNPASDSGPTITETAIKSFIVYITRTSIIETLNFPREWSLMEIVSLQNCRCNITDWKDVEKAYNMILIEKEVEK